jgi:hypothetical protein
VIRVTRNRQTNKEFNLMNEIIPIIGHFEQFPDEILLYLFENYIRLIDLYTIFHSLNHHRINRVLNSVRLYINIPSKDIFHIKSFSYFTSQILSLRLSTFSSDLDLSKMFNLRLLHLEKPTRSQLNTIRGDILPNLRYLSLYPCWYNLIELPNHLTNLNQSSFKYLRVCILPDGKLIRFKPKFDQS